MILNPTECDMLRRIARRTMDDAKGAFVLNGHGIGVAKRLVKLGLAEVSELWKGPRPSGYFRITGAGLAALGMLPC